MLSIWTSLKFCHLVKSNTKYSGQGIKFNVRILSLNSFPNGKILDWSKLKAFADDKIKVNEKLKFGLRRVKNIVGKEKMLVNSILFPQCFQKSYISGLLKVWIVW